MRPDSGTTQNSTTTNASHGYNVARALSRQALENGKMLAYAVCQANGKYLEATFAELERDASLVARQLEKEGLSAGMRAVMMVPPGPAFFAITFGLFKLGVLPVFVDPSMGVSNLKTCLAQANPEVFIGIGKAHVARVLFGWAKDSLKKKFSVNSGFPGTTRLQTAAKASQAGTEEGYAAKLFAFESPAAILFTSGSTGTPKGALYTHGMFEAQVQMIRDAFGIEPGERDLATFPLFALFGPALGMAAVVPFMNTSRPASADPRDLIAACDRYQCTNAFASPAIVELLGNYFAAYPLRAKQADAAKPVRLPSLKRIISAGAPARPEALRRLLLAMSAEIEIYTPYGATEALPLTSIRAKEILQHTAHETAQGKGVCVGRALPGIDLMIASMTDDAIDSWSDCDALDIGQIGEIVVRGGVVSPQYVSRPEATRAAKMTDENGAIVHRMGDVGYLDELGRLWMCGRKSHRVDTPSQTLHSIPVEAIFDAHPAVRWTALVGVRRGSLTIPVLCVEVLNSSIVPAQVLIDELAALAQQREHTREIEYFLIHPRFPVDVRHNAKIFREKLAQWATEQIQ